MNYQERLGITEYTEVLLDSISRMIVTQSYIDENNDFFDHLIFKMWENYMNSLEYISIRKQSQLLEIFLGTLLKEKPSVNLPEDSIDLL